MVSEIVPPDNVNSDHKMRVIFDNSPYAMLIITDGVYIEANEAAFRIKDVNQLIERIDLLLSDSEVAHKMGNIARNVLSAHLGSAEKSSEMLAELAGLTVNSERN